MVVYIKNSKGVKAFAGDKIKLKLHTQDRIDPNRPFRIQEIRPYGIIALEGGIFLDIQDIADFTKCKK